jgi:hypothetical protein
MTDFGLNDSVFSESSVRDVVLGPLANIASIEGGGNFISGARCIVKVNGSIAVFATSVSWNVSTMQDEIITIDSVTPYEIAPKRISVSGTLGGFHVPGWTPSARGIQSDILSFVSHKYISIDVRDRNTDTIMFLTNKAVVTSWQEDINAEGLARLSLNWVAIGWANEIPGRGLQSLTLPEGLRESK